MLHEIPSLIFNTYETEHIPDLIKLLPDDKPAHDLMACVRSGEGVAGWGRVLTRHVSGNNRFQAAATWWDTVLAHASVTNPLELPGTGPVLFSSFSFDPHSTKGSALIIPEVVVGHSNGRSWVTVAHRQDAAEPTDLDRILRPSRKTPKENSTTPSASARQERMSVKEGRIGAQEFMSAIESIKNHIKKNSLSKLVVARDLIVTTTTPIIAAKLLSQLSGNEKSWSVSVDGLIGASPEMLLRQRGTHAFSRALAGSRPAVPDQAATPADTSAFADESMLSDPTLSSEHSFTVQSVIEAFAALGAITTTDGPFVLPLPTIRHIATDVTATLPSTNPFHTLEALHPSAAVCGTPTKKAQRFIDTIEKSFGMDRERFSGPIGWVDSHGNADWCIAIRCAIFTQDHKTVRLHAGCGIVADCDPDTELKESVAKFDTMLTALNAVIH